VAGMTSRAEGEGAEPSDNKKHRARHEGLRGAVTVNPLGYYERGGTGQEQVSTFVLVPIRRSLREDGMLELVVRVEAPDESVMAVVGGRETIVTEWLVPHKAWGSAREFIRALPTARIQWTGGDHEVQGLLATLTDTAKLESLPLTRSTPVVGRHNASDGTPRFVLVAGTLSKDGWMTEPDVIYRVSGSPADRMLSREQSAVGGPGVEVLAREVIPMMLDLHDREITQPTVAWLFACVFAPVFRERLGGFPFLNPWGEQGSGKSSLIIHGLARLFYKSPEPISVKSTPFALISLFAHLNALPALFDEYKEADMGKFVDGFRRRLRANYSGETETRGHQDLTVSSYANTAPVLLCGEQKVEGDPALGERGTFAPFRKRYLHEHPEAKVALDRWRELPVHLLGPSYLCWSLSADFEGMLAEARADCRAVFDKMNLRTIPSRIELNVVMSLFGLIAGERWAQTLGTTFGEIDATEHVASVLRNALGDDVVRTGDVSPLNAVDHFVEDAAELIEQGLAIEGIHWTRTGGLGGKWCTASS